MATGRCGPLAPWLARILMALTLWALAGGIPREALAEVIVDVPAGWAADKHASEEARQRAQMLAARADMRLASVMSTVSADRFSETLIVLESAVPLVPADLADDDLGEALLTRAVGSLIGSDAPPDTFARRILADTAVPHGSWRVGDLSYRVALAPWGPNHTMVVLVTTAAEESLYRAFFSDLVDGLDGVLAPVTPFPVQNWRLGALFAWLLVSLLIYAIAANMADQAGDYTANGRGTAFTLLMMALLAGGVVHVVLGGQLTELRVAGISRERVASEVAGLGGAVALLVLLVTRWMGRSRKIASAPGVGAFASRSGAFKVGGGLYDSSGVDLLKVETSESPANLTPEPPEPGDVSGPVQVEQAPVELPGVEPFAPNDVEFQVDAAVEALIESPAAASEPPAAAAVEPRAAPKRERPVPPTLPRSSGMPAPGVVELPDAPEEVMEVDAILEEVDAALEDMATKPPPAEEAETVMRRAPAPQRIDDDRDTARRDLAPPDDDMATVARPAPTDPKKRPSPWRRRPVSEYSVRTIKPRGSGPPKK